MRLVSIPTATVAAIAVLALAVPHDATGQERDVPYWASIRAKVLNMRAGPGRAYPVRWTYKRVGLPLKVVRVHEGWRLVRDPDGDEGWVIASLLSPDRAALVVGDGLADMREASDTASRLMWRAEPGVSGKLGKCQSGWCEFNVDGRKAWVESRRLWGPGKP